jgi:hypothetical protein
MSVCTGAVLVYPGGIPCGAWRSPAWSVEYLTSMFGATSGSCSGSGSPQVFSV